MYMSRPMAFKAEQFGKNSRSYVCTSPKTKRWLKQQTSRYRRRQPMDAARRDLASYRGWWD
jgi:hypothetical protein